MAALSGEYIKKPFKLDLDLKNRANPPVKPSIEAPPVLELKALPPHLKYVFLGANNTFPVIIAADLSDSQVDSLVEVLKKYIKAIGWTIADIVGIAPSVCSHKIQLTANCKPSAEHQRRLNPPMQEVVKMK